MISPTVAMKICSNPNCRHLGKPLPHTEFNKGRNTCKDCDRERARIHAKKRRERLWAERKPIIDEHLGSKCVVCEESEENLLRCHEIFGNHHPPLLETPVDEVERNCMSERFVRVCAKCHGKAHSLMDKGIRNWSQIFDIVREFIDTNPPMTSDENLRAWRSWLKKRMKQVQKPALISYGS